MFFWLDLTSRLISTQQDRQGSQAAFLKLRVKSCVTSSYVTFLSTLHVPYKAFRKKKSPMM